MNTDKSVTHNAWIWRKDKLIRETLEGFQEMAGWSSEREDELIQEALRKFNREQKDPHFLVLGATGAGKSSLINRLFGENLHAVNDIASTTRAFKTEHLKDSSGNTTLVLTDSPGYGEVGHDEEYALQAVEQSAKAHVIVLVLKGDEKGYQRDLDILKNIFGTPEFSGDQPLIIVVNQIDKLAPTREWNPPYNLNSATAPTDSDKVRHMKEKVALVQEQFMAVTKRKPIVCPTMSEPREGEIFGVQELKEHLYNALPDAARLKFARASKLAEEASKEMRAQLDKEATRIVAAASTAAATMVFANPLPLSDWAVLMPIQMSMIVGLGALYGKRIDPHTAKETLVALGAGFAARTAFQGLISFFPGVKNLIGPPYAAAATHGMGISAKAYFTSGLVPSKEVIQLAMDRELKRLEN